MGVKRGGTTYTIITDGSGLHRGPGGYSGTIKFGDRDVKFFGGDTRTTVPRMELYALINGLRILTEDSDFKPGSKVIWLCDALNVVEAVNDPEKRKANKDLWHYLTFFESVLTVSGIFVCKDSGLTEHDEADYYASMMYQVLKDLN